MTTFPIYAEVGNAPGDVPQTTPERHEEALDLCRNRPLKQLSERSEMPAAVSV